MGKAVQERPVSSALTLGSVDPARRMVPRTSSSCIVCSWALRAAHTKDSVFFQKLEMSNEPCPTKGSIEGGTCSDQGVSSYPRDAKPDLSEPVQEANLFELE